MEGRPGYDYVERDRQQDGGTKTYEELMILGSPYERLIAVNGKPLSPEQQEQEQQKLEAAVVERQGDLRRRGGSGSQSMKKSAKAMTS